MRSYTWNCPRCRAIYNTNEPPAVWTCRFCLTPFMSAPAYVEDGDGS